MLCPVRGCKVWAARLSRAEPTSAGSSTEVTHMGDPQLPSGPAATPAHATRPRSRGTRCSPECESFSLRWFAQRI